MLLAPVAMAAPEDQDTFDDFESINTATNEAFNIGTAQFSGNAFSGVAGIGELYHSGSHAWMVNPVGVATIDFGATNAATVEFWTRLRTGANGSSIYTSFDDAGTVIESTTLDTPGDFQLLSFTGDIDHITIENFATGNLQMNSIDDFGFTAVPEPGSLAALAVGSLVMLRRRRR